MPVCGSVQPQMSLSWAATGLIEMSFSGRKLWRSTSLHGKTPAALPSVHGAFETGSVGIGASAVPPPPLATWAIGWSSAPAV